MLCCVYTHTNMLASCTQRHTQTAWFVVLVLRLFRCYFHLWIILIEILEDGCPGSWDFRLLEVPPINSWSLKVHHTVTVLWNICCHIAQSTLNTLGPNTFSLSVFSPACTCVQESPSPLTECFPAHGYGLSFVQEFTVLLSYHACYSACKCVTASNASKFRSPLGWVAYKGRRAPAWWQTQRRTPAVWKLTWDQTTH